MKRRVCILMAVLSLLLPGCNRRPEATAKGKTLPRLTTLNLSPDGEIIPPPSDVRAVARRSQAVAAQKTSAATPPQDQALVLMAKMAQQQDAMQQTLNKADDRNGAFGASTEAHSRQIQQIQEEQLPKLTQKLATTAEQLSETTQNLEKRIAAVESASRDYPSRISGAQMPQIIPQPQRTLEKSAVAETPRGVPVVAEPITASIQINAARWTPYAQRLRAQVRGAYEKVIQEFPNSPEAADAYMGLAGMSEEDEDWPAAIDWFKRLLSEFPTSPSSPEAQFRMAGALASKGAWDDARKAYLLGADTYPRHSLAIPALLGAADCLAHQGKTSEALREYKTIERAQQGSAFAQKACMKTAELLHKEKRFPEAIEAYKSALQYLNDERRPDLEMQLALAQLSAGQYERARETLNTLLPRATAEPLGWLVRLHLARAFEEEEKPLDAARAFAQLADKFPNALGVLDARMRAAHAYLSAELAEHAVEQIDAVLRGLPSAAPDVREKLEPQALYTAARAARQMGDMAKSKARLESLRDKYPNHTLALDADLEEANTLVQAGRAEAAIALLRQVVRRHPSSPRATAVVMRIAELQERSGKAMKGISVYSELLNVSADINQNAHYKLRRGLLVQEVGRDDEAAAVFQALLDDVNTPKAIAALARYQHALIDQRAGRLPDAIAGYEKFLEEGRGSKPLTGVDLTGLLDEAKWKISKLQWLSSQEKEKAPLPAQVAKSKPHAL